MTPNPRFQFSPPSRTGTIAVELGEPAYWITALERPSLEAPAARKSKLITATGDLTARISPDGERVLVRREATLDGEPATQLEVWPFDSGSGTPLGPPRKGLQRGWWSSDGRTIYRLAKGAAPGQLDFSRIEVASGRPLETHPVQDSIEFIYDSLLLYLSVGRGSDGTPRELRSWTRAGGSPLVFSFPDTAPHKNAEIVSPDGHGSWLGALITSKGPGSGGPPRTFTLYIARPGVPTTRFPPFEGPWADLTFIHSGPGPVFEILAEGFDGSLRRLLLEPGRPPRDVGPWALPPWPWLPSFSDNGRRGVVRESELRTDIWLLEWPGADSAGAGGKR